MNLAAGILTLLLAASPGGADNIAAAVAAHYDSLLAGRVVAYDLQLRSCPKIAGDCRVVRVEGDEGGGIPRGSRLCRVVIRQGGGERTLPVTLTVKTVELVPVATRDIPPRTRLSDSLISWRALETTKLGATRLPDRSTLAVCRARTRLNTGGIITMRRIEPVPEVRIGEQVKLVYHRGGIVISGEGKALEDGRNGERVLVQPEFAKKRLEGTVQPDGTVMVD